MSAGTCKGRIFKILILACAATVLGASYALDATSRFRDARSGAEDPGDVIADFQKPEFLAYVKRRQRQSDPRLERVSVGDCCLSRAPDTANSAPLRGPVLPLRGRWGRGGDRRSEHRPSDSVLD